MEQTKLAMDLERRSPSPRHGFEPSEEQKQEIAALLAQAIVAVHRGARNECNGPARREEDDDVDE